MIISNLSNLLKSYVAWQRRSHCSECRRPSCVADFGGNWNNGSNVGAFRRNLNIDHTNSIKCVGMLFSHKGVFLTPESKIRMTQQYQDIINHIKSDSVTQTDLGQAAAMNGWLSNSTDQTFKNQLKI